MIRPPRADLPIYLAAVGPRNVELAGEIADGWLAVFFAPDLGKEALEHLRAGRRRAGREDLTGFDIVPNVPVVVGHDVGACADAVRSHAALYLGGMGSREANFYNRLAVRMGYADAAARIQDHYLSGRHREAAAAVPVDFLDHTSLLGPVERLADRLSAYAEAGVTTLSAAPHAPTVEARIATLRALAEALERSGVGD
jgi:alkanesulfonate monooxygenase SsuD/methylene tetrahydromethanopterin reductase-like flavin-dependent oxidoreductase (luciferase family)